MGPIGVIRESRGGALAGADQVAVVCLCERLLGGFSSHGGGVNV